MEDLFSLPYNLGFFALFAFAWLTVTSLLSLLSGWFSLMRRYPDRPNEKPLIMLTGQSGSMGVGVRMNGILRLSATPSGLRVGMSRIFGPFCQDFFVPWSAIRVSRKKVLLWQYAELSFGVGDGSLKIDSFVADRIWTVIPGNWPEHGQPPAPETRNKIFLDIFRQWLMMTTIASVFFLYVTQVKSNGSGPPPAVAIVFPAIVFGFWSVIAYQKRSNLPKK